MTNPSKAKGTRWENLVCGFLREHGFTEAFRLAPAGDADAGDIGGVPGWAFECRDRTKHDLSKNVRDANSRAENKGARFGCAVVKKREHTVGDAYVVLDLRTFVEVLKELSGPNH
jgi:hypothetical protein